VSAAEVIEQIEKLPREERQKVVAYLRESEHELNAAKVDAEVSAEFKRIAAEVFTTNAELFRKLAQ
jgi:hypothetical protein